MNKTGKRVLTKAAGDDGLAGDVGPAGAAGVAGAALAEGARGLAWRRHRNHQIGFYNVTYEI